MRGRAALQRYMARLREDFEAGDGVVVQPSVVLQVKELRIGRGTRINRHCVLKGLSPISIGNYCGIGEAVRFISTNHAMNMPNLNAELQKQLLDHLDGSADRREGCRPSALFTSTPALI